MNSFKRGLEEQIKKALLHQKSVLLLGARQTGKTTLCTRLDFDLRLNFSDLATRQYYEQYPERLRQETQDLKQKLNKLPCVLIDEVQKNPKLLDLIQVLIDEKLAQFVLTGSSVRKLRRGGGVNLLPGRVIHFELDPLVLSEYPEPLPRLESLMVEGSLPEIRLIQDDEIKRWTLETYVATYLEEEIREEAQARDLGKFGRFLELVASESGNLLNFSKLASEIGVSAGSITNYFEILEDSLLVHRIEPFFESKKRRQLTKTHKYLLFDLGVRQVAAKEPFSLSKEQQGRLFEQWAGLELLRKIRMNRLPFKLQYWRDKNGIEVDWVLSNSQKKVIPVEIKWTQNPKDSDVKHLRIFLKEYPEVEKAFLICNVPRAFEFQEKITVLPWKEINRVFP